MELNTRNFWFESKALLREAIGLSSDQAHVHMGLALFLFSAIAFRRSRHGLLWAWITVFILQTLNEMMDARDWIMWTGDVNWVETTKDYAVTLFWPAVLCVTLKHVMPTMLISKTR